MMNHPSTERSSRGALAKLRDRLKNLALLDAQGEWVGQVKDLKFAPDGNLNLIVAGEDEQNQSIFFTISTIFIQKIEPATQSLYINLSANQIKELPEYSGLATQNFRQDQAASLPKGSQSRERMNSRQNISNKTLNMDTHQIADQSPVFGDESSPEKVEEYQIRLLEERLVVDRQKRKVGEVVVRKTIETEIIEVPIRREKLIVEQISPETKQLAEIDLQSPEDTRAELLAAAGNLQQKPVVKGEFKSPQVAARILDAIANRPTNKPVRVRVEIVLENGEDLAAYQEWFTRYSQELNQGM